MNLSVRLFTLGMLGLLIPASATPERLVAGVTSFSLQPPRRFFQVTAVLVHSIRLRYFKPDPPELTHDNGLDSYGAARGTVSRHCLSGTDNRPGPDSQPSPSHRFVKSRAYICTTWGVHCLKNSVKPLCQLLRLEANKQ